MPNLDEEKAFSLVEVIVAMALLLIIFVISAQIVMNTMTQSNTIDEDFTSMEIADGVLNAYKTKPLDELDSQLNREVEVNIADVLELQNSNDFEKYEAKVKVTKPDDSSLSNQLLKIIVTINSSHQQSQLEGYVER